MPEGRIRESREASTAGQHEATLIPLSASVEL